MENITTNKTLAISHSTLPTKPMSSNVKQAYTDRMMLSEALQAVHRLVEAFPNGGSTAGKSYIGTIAALLCSYPRSIAMQCADPLRGVARETKFLPTVADIVAWCEPKVAGMHSSVSSEDCIRRQFEERREREEKYGAPPVVTYTRANVLVRASLPVYAEMIERAKTANPEEFQYVTEGIMVAEDWIRHRWA